MFIQSGAATIGSPNTAYVTVISNDNPYGIIQFQNVSRKHYQYILKCILDADKNNLILFDKDSILCNNGYVG